MTERPYQRRPGDFEIRVLKDSRIVLVAPDQTLLDLGRQMTEPPDRPDQNDNQRDPDDTTARGTSEIGTSE